MAQPMYKPLPGEIVERLSKIIDLPAPQSDGASKEEFKDFLMGHMDQHQHKDEFKELITNSHFGCRPTVRGWMHKYARKSQKNASEEKKNVVTKARKGKTSLTSQERRELGLHRVNKLNKTFEMFLPINEMWKDYAKKYLGVRRHQENGWRGEEKDNVTTNIQNNVRKIEYFGCFLRVTKSRCSEYIGTVGIVIRETKNTFTIICPDDKVKTIPKKHSEFSFVVENVGFSIFGSHLNQKSAIRAKNIFKKHCLWL